MKAIQGLFSAAAFTLLLCSSSALASTTVEFEQLLTQQRGKVVYLDFWASWCGPCRKSFPWMNEMTAKYSVQDFVIISVNVDNDRTLAAEFLEQSPANFTIFYDPQGKVARQYQLKGMPSSYLIDKSGAIVSAHVGFNEHKKKQYQQEIVRLLTDSPL